MNTIVSQCFIYVFLTGRCAMLIHESHVALHKRHAAHHLLKNRPFQLLSRRTQTHPVHCD